MTSLVSADPRAISAEQLAAVLSNAAAPRMVFQPLVDTVRGVVAGYEALARFDAEPFRPPDEWFAAAARYGVAAQLEARALLAALAERRSMPADCFLTVNLSPHLLGSPEIARVLSGRDLRGIVVELTEHVAYGSDPSLLLAIARLREAGALIALDDAGSGYSGLEQLLAIRPEIVKLDRGLVSGIDSDEAKLALVRMLGEVAGQLDAWMLAEGVETEGEHAAFAALGVPLAQGWLFGRPEGPWGRISEEGRAALRAHGRRRDRTGTVGAFLEKVPMLQLPARFATAGGGTGRLDTDTPADVYLAREQLPEPVAAETVIAVDEWSRPHALLLATSGRAWRAGGPAYRLVPTVLRVDPATGVAEAATRAMTRPAATRFDPLVATAPDGRCLGLVRIERLVGHLAGERAGSASSASPPTSEEQE